MPCDISKCSSHQVMVYSEYNIAFGHSIFNISHINQNLKNTTYVM